MTTCRRFLLLAAFAFWQGGFTFYSAVVVPVGDDVLGSSRQQGFITRRVTNYLNVAGCVAFPLAAWDAWAAGGKTMANLLRWLAMAGMAVTLAAQGWLHTELDRVLRPDEMLIADQQMFRLVHERYLIASTAQWLFCLAFIAVGIHLWRKDDAYRSHHAPPW